MSSSDDLIDDAETDQMAAFLSRCVKEILGRQDAGSFLQWLEKSGPSLLPGPFAAAPDPQTRRALAAALGSTIWNATPLPENGYRPRPLPRPERNEPCPCGSGRKYKKCCALAPAFPPIPADAIWSMLVEHLPLRELKRLARERALPEPALEGAAERLRDAGRPARAIRLLEPLFDVPDRLDGRHEGALDLLLDLYDGTGRPARKRELMQRLETRLRPPLRASLLQRMASIAAGEGRLPAAWEYFERARRDDAEDPALAGLEVMLLIQDQQAERATERARFWLSRLRRQRPSVEPRILGFLDEVARDPVATLAAMCGPDDGGSVARLVRGVRQASDRPLPAYALEAVEGNEVCLVPPAALRKLEQRWACVWPIGKPFSIQLPDDDDEVWETERSGPWLTFLERHPEAFDSLSILDDLVMAATALGGGAAVAVDQALVLPLAGRGEAILEHALAARTGARVPWPVPDNRPALRLLALKADVLERHRDGPAAVALMERLIALNPGDNHGYRAPLMGHCLRARQDERALELAARYAPEDVFAETLYGRVLALLRLGRRGDALVALKEAIETLPLVPKYLLDPDPSAPKLREEGFTIRGPDQAWLYRQAALDLWRDTPGALEWLASAAGPLTRRR
jgi:tetratricopeptide (TPR) repeat protein